MVKGMDDATEDNYLIQTKGNKWEFKWVDNVLKNNRSFGNYINNNDFSSFAIPGIPNNLVIKTPTTSSAKSIATPKTAGLMKKQGFFGKLEREIKGEYTKLTSSVDKAASKFEFFEKNSQDRFRIKSNKYDYISGNYSRKYLEKKYAMLEMRRVDVDTINVNGYEIHIPSPIDTPDFDHWGIHINNEMVAYQHNSIITTSDTNHAKWYHLGKFDGSHAIGFDKKIMQKALKVVRSQWDIRANKQAVHYNVETHNCHNFVYAAVNEYVREGGIIHYFK